MFLALISSMCPPWGLRDLQKYFHKTSRFRKNCGGGYGSDCQSGREQLASPCGSIEEKSPAVCVSYFGDEIVWVRQVLENIRTAEAFYEKRDQDLGTQTVGKSARMP